MTKPWRHSVQLLVSFLLVFILIPNQHAVSQARKAFYLPLVQRTTAPFTFISWSDTKNGTAALTTLSKQARALQPAFTIFAGDLEPSGFSKTEITAWKTAMNGGANNGMFDITLPVRGNHDEANTSGWQAYFDMAATAGRVKASNFAALAADLTYTFTYGNSVFIGIDVLGPSTLLKTEQIAYLDQVLTGAETRKLTHAFIYFHGPVYPVGEYATCPTRTCPAPDRVAELIAVLNKHPIVSAVFQAHDHVQAYVHLDRSRMTEISHPFEEFVTGTTGAGPDPCNKPYRYDYCGAFYGFWTVRVDGNAFSVSVYQIEHTTPVKSFSFRK